MALPKAIQAQVDQAEAITQQLAQESVPQVQTVESLIQPANAPTVNPTETEPQAQQLQTPTPPPVDEAEQRYRTLKGKYDAEVPRLNQALRERDGQMQEMARQLSELKVKVEQASEKPKQRPDADPKDVENFGQDLVEMVQRYAEQMFQYMSEQISNKATQFEGRLAALEQQVNGVSQKADTTLETQFYATLGAIVPDWEQINSNDKWLAWLAEIDPVYGAPRQAALDAAHQRMDVQRVAAVFNAFKQSRPASPQKALENQVAPSGAASAAPVQAQGKPVLSAKSIEQFYNDVSKGKYNSRPQERDRLMAEIDIAVAEGRVR